MSSFSPFRRYLKPLLFFSSYVPLILIFSIRYYKTFRYFTIFGIVVSIILSIILLSAMKSTKKLNTMGITLSKISYKSSDLLAYMFSYIFPFLNFKLERYIDMLSLGFFFIMLAIVYINLNIIYINPMLSLFGYKIFEIADEKNNTFVLITKRGKLIVGNKIQACELGSNVLRG